MEAMGYNCLQIKMKKLMLLFFCSLSVLSFAQYNPTRNDLGRDCATQDGKLGTWKEVTVTETYSTSENQNHSNTTSQNFNASAGVEVEAYGTTISGSASYDNGSSNTSGSSNSSTNTSSRSYQDIQCVEDKNANLPQYTPVRW